jgi:hypothetical protein
MMLAPPAFPAWLPPAVAEEAQRLLNAGYAEDELVLRLATDERMKLVWRELKRHEQFSVRPQISDALAKVRSRDTRLAHEESALALFFWCAYALAFMQPRVGTFSKHRVPILFYRWQAAQLRVSKAVLRELHEIPADTRGFLTDYVLDEHEYHARQIADAAKFCDEIAVELTKLEAVEAPLVVHRNHGHREARGYVRMLAVETRKLFGAKLYGTLANVASWP